MAKDYGRDIFNGRLDERSRQAGVRMQNRMQNEGALVGNSVDTERDALKTWILWRDGPLMRDPLTGESMRPTIECELIVTARASDSSEAVGALLAQCPVCKQNGKDEHLLIREDNKELSFELVKWGDFKRMPRDHHIRQHWPYFCREKYGRAPRDGDQMALVSSPERWQCPTCHAFCVRVQDSIATNDFRGASFVRSFGNVGG